MNLFKVVIRYYGHASDKYFNVLAEDWDFAMQKAKGLVKNWKDVREICVAAAGETV